MHSIQQYSLCQHSYIFEFCKDEYKKKNMYIFLTYIFHSVQFKHWSKKYLEYHPKRQLHVHNNHTNQHIYVTNNNVLWNEYIKISNTVMKYRPTSSFVGFSVFFFRFIPINKQGQILPKSLQPQQTTKKHEK